MPHSWEEIQKHWLLNQVLPYEPMEVVEAFNEVESVLGLDLNAATHIARGLWVAIPIIELGRLLKVIKEIPNNATLIQKIKDNNPFQAFRITKRTINPTYKKTDSAAEYSHAIQVAQLAAHYRRHSMKVEIEPELIVNGRKKAPDLRVEINSNWVYVEVVSPNFSEQVQESYQILARISDITRDLKPDTLVEVYLFRDPSEEEILLVIEKCKEVANDFSMQEIDFDGLAKIYVSSNNEERLPHFAPAMQEKRPILVMIGFRQTNENGIVHSSRVIAKIPITDERAQTILSDKSRQLSRTDPGVIVIDVSDVPSGFKRWPYLISNRLQPNLNRRITAVLVVENHVSGNRMTTAKKLIKHPNPLHQLPEFFFDVTSSTS